ncbi:MAG: 2,3-bisphosphoglycerate-independent phosphoglycerate mutase [Candidatus Paracaedibacteraceae bacterium]|nr:2,3-bisphosphoglycerate-independent phosphoglycerate mutase [Candidatus Paracaedibacteraceae bacterium]
MMSNKVLLCILDGWGIRNTVDHNGIALANTPHWDRLLKTYPHSLLQASELNVGLPKGQMGNSEVGHMTIGSGRVVLQELPRINEAIQNGQVTSLPVWQRFVVQAKNKTVHVLGLLSDGGVHSHQDQIAFFAKEMAKAGLSVKVHGFLDGRDTPPDSAVTYVQKFIDDCHGYDIEIVSLGGRYYGMDRDKRWDRIEVALDAIIQGKGVKFTDPIQFIQDSYAAGVTDEFVVPGVRYGYSGFQAGDSLFVGNFRADRMRQILSKLVDDQRLTQLLGLVEYSADLAPKMLTLFQKEEISATLGSIVSDAGLKQFRAAETEKYAHVTFFLNGGREDVYPGEERQMVASPKVSTYDLKPEMSAPELTSVLVSAIESGQYSLIVCNYANPDMVGHTGVQNAIVQAVETVDACLGKLEEAAKEQGYAMIITADHGNVELMIDPETGGVHTAHTLNPVPFVLVNSSAHHVKDGGLKDIAPTILTLLGIAKTSEMTGSSLISDN